MGAVLQPKDKVKVFEEFKNWFKRARSVMPKVSIDATETRKALMDAKKALKYRCG